MNQFPPSPEYPMRAVSNLYGTFPEIFAAQGAPMAYGKYINQKTFNYFVWTPLGSRVNILINIFSFKFT
jgi:hypothetical protein